MALIGKLRERSGLVLGLVAVAVVGFVAMDMTQGGPGGSSSIFDNPNVMGKVDGTKINRQEFEKTRSILYDRNGDLNSSAQLWNFFVEKAIVEKEANCLGLEVNAAEMDELQYGPDVAKLSPIIQQRFADQSTGQVNLNLLGQYKDAMASGDLKAKNPERYNYWVEQEKEIVKERLQAKFNAMVSKGAYTPSWMAQKMYADQNTKIDFLAVKVPFAMVKDEEASVSDADYKSYIADNKGMFFRVREGRKIAYGTFNVMATSADSMEVAKSVETLKAGFRASKNDTTYINTNGGVLDGSYTKKAKMSAQAADSLFNKPVGAVVGPYLDGGSYRVAKITNRRVLADSIRARHILFKGLAPKTTDSLLAGLKGGKISWDTLNKQSTDVVSAKKGGDLGYFSQEMMVKEFSDLCYYKAEQGKYYTVNTQFGTHIVQVTGVKNIKNEQAVQIAYVQAPIEPSRTTQDKVKEKAVTIVQQCKTLDALKVALEKEGIQLEMSAPLEENDFQIGNLGGTSRTREMVRWANGAKAGQVAAEVFDFANEGQYYTNKFVVAGLKAILPAGLPSVADVKEDIEVAVKNRKKGEVIKAKLAGKDLNGAMATFPNTKIDTIRQANFAGQFVPGLGNEPKVLGAVFTAAQNTATEPILGTNAVYVAQVTNKADAQAPADMTQIQKQLINAARSQLRGRLLPTMKDKANIADYRSKGGN